MSVSGELCIISVLEVVKVSNLLRPSVNTFLEEPLSQVRVIVGKLGCQSVSTLFASVLIPILAFPMFLTSFSISAAIVLWLLRHSEHSPASDMMFNLALALVHLHNLFFCTV